MRVCRDEEKGVCVDLIRPLYNSIQPFFCTIFSNYDFTYYLIMILHIILNDYKFLDYLFYIVITYYMMRDFYWEIVYNT